MNSKKFTSTLWSVLAMGLVVSHTTVAQQNNPAAFNKQQVNQQKSAVYFTENKGQIHDGNYNRRSDVLFVGHTPQEQFAITNTGVSHQLKQVTYKSNDQLKKRPHLSVDEQQEVDKVSIYRVDMQWVNANTQPQVEKIDALPGIVNYNNIPYMPHGVQGVKDFSSVRLKQVYPGIDIRFYANGNHVEYDFEIAPNADYRQIKIKIAGTDAQLTADGQLEMKTPFGTIAESAPVVFQQGKQLLSKWKQLDNETWGFEIADYNPTAAVVIDPISRVWGTYTGGNGDDVIYGMSKDASGNIFVTGYTTSTENIVTFGVHQQAWGGLKDAYVAKFQASSSQRLWATFHGGTQNDEAWNCVVDNATNDLYFVGNTSSSTGIATNPSHQSAYGLFDDAFLGKYNGANGTLYWATYYGGPSNDYGYGIALDQLGGIYIFGETYSGSGIATTGTHQVVIGGSADAFVARFNASGSRIWGTYLGGNGAINEAAVTGAVDASGNVYFAGYTTTGSNLHTTGAHDVTYNGGTYDGFIVKLNSSGIRQWGTYYGTDGSDFIRSMRLDAAGNIIVAGTVESAISSGANITTAGTHQPAYNGGVADAFVAKFNANGVRQWGTYYGGGGADYATSVSVDAFGEVFLLGYTNSTTNVASAGEYDVVYGGGTYDAYLVRLSPNGVRRWGTYYGGPGNDIGRVVLDIGANIYIVGQTASTSTIASTGAYQTALYGGTWDGFIVKLLDPTSLPIQLSFFKGECKNGVTQLNWQTATELNNAFFSIEKSSDGTNWVSIATINAVGNSNTAKNYQYTDKSAVAGNLYRLKQTDLDGSYTYAATINITCKKEGKTLFTITPNPVINTMKLSLSGLVDKGAYSITIYDVSGKIVFSKNQLIQTETHNEFVSLDHLSRGTYLVKIISANETFQSKIIKQ